MGETQGHTGPEPSVSGLSLPPTLAFARVRRQRFEALCHDIAIEGLRRIFHCSYVIVAESDIKEPCPRYRQITNTGNLLDSLISIFKSYDGSNHTTRHAAETEDPVMLHLVGWPLLALQSIQFNLWPLNNLLSKVHAIFLNTTDKRFSLLCLSKIGTAGM